MVRSLIHIYKPLLTWAMPRRNLVMWSFAALLIVGAGLFPLDAVLGISWRTVLPGRGRRHDLLHHDLHRGLALAIAVLREPGGAEPGGRQLPEDRHRLHAARWTKEASSTCRSPCPGRPSPRWPTTSRPATPCSAASPRWKCRRQGGPGRHAHRSLAAGNDRDHDQPAAQGVLAQAESRLRRRPGADGGGAWQRWQDADCQAVLAEPTASPAQPATMAAMGRIDAALRSWCLQAHREFEAQLGPQLVRRVRRRIDRPLAERGRLLRGVRERGDRLLWPRTGRPVSPRSWPPGRPGGRQPARSNGSPRNWPPRRRFELRPRVAGAAGRPAPRRRGFAVGDALGVEPPTLLTDMLAFIQDQPRRTLARAGPRRSTTNSSTRPSGRTTGTASTRSARRRRSRDGGKKTG